MRNEIVLYQPDEQSVRIEVQMYLETVWLTRQQMAGMFGRDVKTIGKHINNVFSEGELEKEVVVAKFATTTQHGAKASLKDLGKKWFAFSRMDKNSVQSILNKILQLI